MMGVVAMGTLEANALELGWQVIGYRGREDERRAILECVGCLARIARRLQAISRGDIRPCTHPVVDELRPYLEDLPCRLLVHRFGPMTLDEIGQALGLTRERVRQIEAKALARLRAACERNGVRVEDFLASLSEAAA